VLPATRRDLEMGRCWKLSGEEKRRPECLAKFACSSASGAAVESFLARIGGFPGPTGVKQGLQPLFGGGSGFLNFFALFL